MDCSAKTRVMVVDDHALFRDGLRMLLERESDLEVVGMAGDGGEAVRMARSVSPDVILMDLSMPGMGGLQAMRQIGPDSARIIILSMYHSPALHESAVAAGAYQFLTKDAEFPELAKAIRTAAQAEAPPERRTE